MGVSMARRCRGGDSEGEGVRGSGAGVCAAERSGDGCALYGVEGGAVWGVLVEGMAVYCVDGGAVSGVEGGAREVLVVLVLDSRVVLVAGENVSGRMGEEKGVEEMGGEVSGVEKPGEGPVDGPVEGPVEG